jgi:hypothetical protein
MSYYMTILHMTQAYPAGTSKEKRRQQIAQGSECVSDDDDVPTPDIRSNVVMFVTRCLLM